MNIEYEMDMQTLNMLIDMVPSRKLGVSVKGDNEIVLRYSCEADLRRSLAKAAWAYGWLVREEVVVPGWGRIDLVLRESEKSTPYLIELKQELVKPAKIRRAVQQADGYGRWWKVQHGEEAFRFLAAAEADMSLIRPVVEAYPMVNYRGVLDVMCGLYAWGTQLDVRNTRAVQRMNDLQRDLAVANVALSDLRVRASREGSDQ